MSVGEAKPSFNAETDTDTAHAPLANHDARTDPAIIGDDHSDANKLVLITLTNKVHRLSPLSHIDLHECPNLREQASTPWNIKDGK